ncbi:hypothetical protein [Fluviicola chungangensis]|uniref:Uncharacterized protein n=1 Tax=Fluviicola chungangensis TaxID=2597671 RepID=A0A556MN51_9FLAO|nr:hypothetical protein [Fluviicola chungangensis]TSJ41350.1 hypothetical protein FO442_15680 [Fluviicola chungangensis]
MKNYLLSLLLLTAFNVFSQYKSYVEYYKLVNKAEEEFVLKMDSSCFMYYDRAFASNKPFLKDPYIAAQIALYLNDSLRFRNYLSIAFKNGMPLKSVTAGKFIRDRYYPELYKTIVRLYKQYGRQPNVDKGLLEQICVMCYQSDSLKLKTGGESQQFYQNENETRRFLAELLNKGVFPNEHLLGITTAEMWTEFYKKTGRKDLYADSPMTDPDYCEECELRLKCPMNIVLHSQCFFQENKELFFKALEAGYLHPKDYGILEEKSILWFKEKSTNASVTFVCL